MRETAKVVVGKHARSMAVANSLKRGNSMAETTEV
jgi:hypothetical protein